MPATIRNFLCTLMRIEQQSRRQTQVHYEGAGAL